MELNSLDRLYDLGNQQISKKICVPLVIVAEKGEPTVYLVFCLDCWLFVAVAVYRPEVNLMYQLLAVFLRNHPLFLNYKLHVCHHFQIFFQCVCWRLKLDPHADMANTLPIELCLQSPKTLLELILLVG